MRKKIFDIIRGKIEYQKQELSFQENDILFEVEENDIYLGTISFCVKGERPVRGIATSSNSHVFCLTSKFEGSEIAIEFEYRADSLCEGMEDSGNIVISCTEGEYLIPFQAKITKHYLKSPIGKIKTLNDFVNLARLNWDEALHIFQSPHFVNIFHEDTEDCLLLYQGLSASTLSSSEMEEFLIGVGKKKRNFFWISEKERKFNLSDGMMSDVLHITKNEWGYIGFQLSCDSPFVMLPKKQVDMQDFTGKHVEIEYHIDPSLMHHGKNYARITAENYFQKNEVMICAEREADIEEDRSYIIKKNQVRYQLIRKYIDFEISKIPKEEWAQDSLGMLDSMIALEPDNHWLFLYKSYILFRAGKQDEAIQIRDMLGRKIKKMGSPSSGFYLYLTTLPETDDSKKKEVTQKVREIFRRYDSHPVLVWILLQLDDVLLRNSERKYRFLKKYMNEFSYSPLFYLEGYKIVKEHPEFLHPSEVFTERLLYWVSRQNMLTDEMVLRTLSFAKQKKEFRFVFYHLLCNCSKQMPHQMEMVKTICAYLIKMNRSGTRYFKWFNKGVLSNLSIAGIYESYLMSWTKSEGEIPDGILKYFSMDNALLPAQKALLYAYILQNRDVTWPDWEPYMVLIYNFARRELGKNHASEDLAVIYEEIRKLLPESEWEEIKGRSENMYRVIVSGDNFTRLHVLQDGSYQIQEVPIHQKNAYFFLYRKPYVLLLEDIHGYLHVADAGYRMKKLLTGELKEMAPGSVSEQKAERNSTPPREDEVESLLENWQGSAAELYALVQEAESLGLPVMQYKEQLLVRMIFTGNLINGHEQIFQAICKANETAQIRDAYVSLCAWEYLIEERVLPDPAASYIEAAVKNGRSLNEYCRIAFLRYCWEKGDYSPDAEKICASVSEGYILDNRYFGFFNQMPQILKRRYLLENTYFVQFVAETNMSVVLRAEYKEPGTPLQSVKAVHKNRLFDMAEAAHCIYTAAIPISPGETISCRIYRNSDNKTLKLFEYTSLCSQNGHAELSRYEMLSDITADFRVRQDTVQKYAELDDVTDILFQPIVMEE